MTKFKFEGDVDGISERQFEFVSNVLSERGFKDETVLVSPVGKADDNFGSNVKRFTVEKNGETFKMVAKIALTNENVRDIIKLAFNIEHNIYTRIFPKFTEIEKGADIPENERLKYPICYGSLTEIPNQIILLEDLQVPSFTILDRYVSYTNGTVKLVLKNLARLHSLSYALKNQDPDTYEAFKGEFGNRWAIMRDMNYETFYAQTENDMIQLVDNEYKKVLRGLLTQITSNGLKVAKTFKDSKYSVIQQGDTWTNNVLFRLEGTQPVECCMIDYQLSAPNSPTADILYMIFNCTDYETRSKHYHEWIDYYHEQLDRCLTNFGLKVNFIYPRDQLDADLRRLAKLSLGLSILVVNVIMRDAQEAATFKDAVQSEDMVNNFLKSQGNKLEKSSTLRIKTRVEDLIRSCKELGYL